MNFSNKIIVFLLGLSLGLLVGASFFIFKIDDYISKMELFKSAPDTTIILTQENDKNDQKPVRNNGYTDKQKNGSDKDSSNVSSRDSLGLISSNNSNGADSLAGDSGNTRYNSEEIVVRKDEMLDAKTIDVMNITAVEPRNPKDSLLQKESGIKDESKNGATAYQVEFWQSPINYKGYKMLKNKIVLFGVALNENLKLYKIEDALYMKQQQNVYRLSFTNDFRQFESVKDLNILAKIK